MSVVWNDAHLNARTVAGFRVTGITLHWDKFVGPLVQDFRMEFQVCDVAQCLHCTVLVVVTNSKMASAPIALCSTQEPDTKLARSFAALVVAVSRASSSCCHAILTHVFPMIKERFFASGIQPSQRVVWSKYRLQSPPCCHHIDNGLRSAETWRALVCCRHCWIFAPQSSQPTQLPCPLV